MLVGFTLAGAVFGAFAGGLVGFISGGPAGAAAGAFTGAIGFGSIGFMLGIKSLHMFSNSKSARY